MTGYFLYDHPNRHAPRRANGVKFWGYPARTKPVRLIVIHTAENTPDYVQEDGGAEAVARYQATDVTAANASSYHEIVDSDSTVTMLPDEAVAFGARGANADGIHLSVATKAHLWPSKPKRWRDAALDRLARRAALRVVRHGIPVRLLTEAQVRAGAAGFTPHAVTENVYGTRGRRSDPGAGFPWDEFLTLVTRYASTGRLIVDKTDEDRIRAIIRDVVLEEAPGRFWSYRGRAQKGQPARDDGLDRDDAYEHLRRVRTDTEWLRPRLRRTLRAIAGKLGVDSEV